MSVEIKICGLSTPEAVEACVSAHVDFLGFIFFPKSPRNVLPEQASELRKIMGKSAKAVAVTVDADDCLMDEIVHRMQPDILQLHGSESPSRVAELKARYDLPAIKAFAIRTREDFEKLKSYEEIADRFLLDAKAPEGSELPGGNGVSFDWNLLKQARIMLPYLLSGGLHENNIVEALEISGANSIDVSSGVESSPGVKDIAKIASFIKTVKDYELTCCK